MSDSNVEEDSLISQEDIDKLLDASSIEEAEALISEVTEAESEDDDLGELSQDDIDTLLNSEDEDDDGGLLSQEDIDSLLGGATDIDSAADDDMELISQEDIDQLMTSAGDADIQNSVEDDSGELGDDDELISMDDIQRLLDDERQKISKDNDAPQKNEEDEGGGTDGADEQIDVAGDVPPKEGDGVMSSEPNPLDDTIDESEAADLSLCLMTQDAMDTLIQNAETEASKPKTQDDDPELTAQGETIDTVSLDGVKDELNTDNTDDAGDGTDGDDDVVSQEDIDNLLEVSDDDTEAMDEDILISQDDIDTLLMAADQEDEDVLGDTLDEDLDIGNLDELIESDINEAASESEQVVLEAGVHDGKAADEDNAQETKRFKKKLGMLKSKLVLAALSTVVVLGISIPVVYFTFFSTAETPPPQTKVAALTDEDAGLDIPVESVDMVDAPSAPFIKQSGTLVFPDFVILASDKIEKMTYVHADISIDYSDQRAYHEMNNNSPFYRDLIYDSIQTRIGSENGSEVTEADLIWGIETSLKKVLPPHYIQKVSFKRFKTS
ncbi:MAG: hypothetical protein CSA29_04365 [Desulfobacterales bacterium]|nr:MAG: hypothetical protein CSA29_04365 [Desulfobacterales bacterium]